MPQLKGHNSTPNYDNHFTISNIPFGVVSTPDNPRPQIATRLHGDVFLIPKLLESGLLGEVDREVYEALVEPTLNSFASLGRKVHRQIREKLQTVLRNYQGTTTSTSPSTTTTNGTTNSTSTNTNTTSNDLLKSCSLPFQSITTHLPLHIPDFTDFSCSTHHVLNAGEAVQGVRRLPPGFPYFPVGYGGRSSSIVVSGTDIARPRGQFRAGDQVVFEESRQVDFELEVAVVVGRGTKLGETVGVDESEEHVFGFVLLNDWSARDIQSLEMPPLGPFLGKSFGTTISPWIITIDALEPFRCPSPPKDSSITLAPYLQPSSSSPSYSSSNTAQYPTFSISLSATIQTPTSSTTICRSKFESLYWTPREMIAHQTSNGCPLTPGDFLATGTISGEEEGSLGCLLEATRGGKREVELEGGEKRVYLNDGDAVRFEGWAGEVGREECVGFGECVGVLRGARGGKR